MRVAVLGAGYAGLTVARRLERLLSEEDDIVVVDDSSDHLVQHELHRLIRYPDLADAITVPLENMLSRAEIRQATVTQVDIDGDSAILETDHGTETLEYDYAAVCLGSETNFYGLSGVEEFATPLKSIDDATTIREQALDSAGGSAVVGGGGLSGIQTAGELVELSSSEDLDLDVTLVEMADRIAPGFDTAFAAAIRDELDARGVAIETNVAVESADTATVHLEDGRSLSADIFVWTGGIRGPAAIGGERRPTARDLRVSDSTFVVGDAAEVTDEDGQPVPASAQTAVRQARVAAKNIAALAGSDPVGETIAVAQPDETVPANEQTELAVYKPQTLGWVVSVGDGAVAQVGPIVFSGDPAKATKAAIGAGHLGSVGAVRQASELVAEELGWPTAGPAIDGFEGKPSDVLPTDPGSPSELGGPAAMLLANFEELFGDDQSIDLTAITQQTDRTYPGSVMETLQRTMFDSFGSLFGGDLETLSETTSDTAETVEIEVVDEEGADADDEDAVEEEAVDVDDEDAVEEEAVDVDAMEEGGEDDTDAEEEAVDNSKAEEESINDTDAEEEGSNHADAESEDQQDQDET